MGFTGEAAPFSMIQVNRRGLRATSALTAASSALAQMSDAEAQEHVQGSVAKRAWLSQRDAMVVAQHDKCGWCECRLRDRAVQMDHIRPKARPLYWWLAFDLSNLLAACVGCNGVKSDKWPVRGRRLVRREHPSSVVEVALAVDPTLEDPRPHFEYQLLGGEWLIVALTERGQATVDLLDLNRDRLRSERTDHVEWVLQHWVGMLLTAASAEDKTEFLSAYASLLAASQPERPWSALSRAVLDATLAGSYP